MIASTILDDGQSSPSSFTASTTRAARFRHRPISLSRFGDESSASRADLRGDVIFTGTAPRRFGAVGVDATTPASWAAPSALRLRSRDDVCVGIDAAAPRRPRDAALDDPSPRGDVRVARDRVMRRSLARSLARRVAVCRFASRADASRPHRTRRVTPRRDASGGDASRPAATRRGGARRDACGRERARRRRDVAASSVGARANSSSNRAPPSRATNRARTSARERAMGWKRARSGASGYAPRFKRGREATYVPRLRRGDADEDEDETASVTAFSRAWVARRAEAAAAKKTEDGQAAADVEERVERVVVGVRADGTIGLVPSTEATEATATEADAEADAEVSEVTANEGGEATGKEVGDAAIDALREAEDAARAANDALRAAEDAARAAEDAARAANVALRAAEDAARAAEDALRAAREDFDRGKRVVLVEVTNGARRDEEATEATAKEATATATEATATEVDAEADAEEVGEAANEGVLKRGADEFKYVKRAAGNAVKGELIALDVTVLNGYGEGPFVQRVKAGETIDGVRFDEILSTCYAKAHSSLECDDFMWWLFNLAPTYSREAPDPQAAFDGRQGREFVGPDDFDDTSLKWESPLSEAESAFAREPFNAIYAAAVALGKSKDDPDVMEAITRNTSSSRYLNIRAVYLYVIRVGNIICIYVGESVDVEGRIACHLVAVLDGGAHLQRGHALAREKMEERTAGDRVGFKAYVLLAHDEVSARRLAESYIAYVTKIVGKVPSVLEVARACAIAGFSSEAVYTAFFKSLNSAGTDDHVGLNFSQPGIVHPRDEGGDLSLRAIRELANHRKRKSARVQVNVQVNGEQSATCRQRSARPEETLTCNQCKGPYRRGDGGGHRRGDGGGRLCYGCYHKKWQAAQPAFTCSCGKKVPQGGRSYVHGVHGGERVCNGCYQKAWRKRRNGGNDTK